LKREIIRAVAPVLVGTNTVAHGTVASACSTTDAIASPFVAAGGWLAIPFRPSRLAGERCASV